MSSPMLTDKYVNRFGQLFSVQLDFGSYSCGERENSSEGEQNGAKAESFICENPFYPWQSSMKLSRLADQPTTTAHHPIR